MMNKKADISMNTIVYAAIAVLILVIIIAFVTGGLGKLFKGVGTYTQESNQIKNECQNNCITAKNDITSFGITTWKNSNYCTKVYEYDINGDGKVDSETEIIRCWQKPISINCGKSVSVDAGISKAWINPDLDPNGDGVQEGGCDITLPTAPAEETPVE